MNSYAQRKDKTLSYLNALDPTVLEEYLNQIVQFLVRVSLLPIWLHVDQTCKSSIECSLVSILAISSLKSKASVLEARTFKLFSELASNLVASKNATDQAESPLLKTMVQFNRLKFATPTASQCFTEYVNQMNASSRQFTPSSNQTLCFA